MFQYFQRTICDFNGTAMTLNKLLADSNKIIIRNEYELYSFRKVLLHFSRQKMFRSMTQTNNLCNCL